MIEKILIPLVRSIITGVIAGLVTFVLLWGSWSMGAIRASKTGLIVGVLVLGAAWVINSTSQGREGDNGQTYDSYTPMVAVYREGDVLESGIFPELPISRERWVEFCNKVYPFWNTSEASYTGRNGLMTITEYRQLRDELIRRGFAYWKNSRAHNQGWDFNAVGKSFVKRSLPYPVKRGGGINDNQA